MTFPMIDGRDYSLLKKHVKNHISRCSVATTCLFLTPAGIRRARQRPSELLARVADHRKTRPVVWMLMIRGTPERQQALT